MKVLPQKNEARYFSSVVCVFLLAKFAICVEDDIEINADHQSPLSAVPTNSFTSSRVTESNGTKYDSTESITKHQLSTVSSPADLPDRTTIKANLSHDNIPSRAGLPEHSIDVTISPKPQPLIKSTTMLYTTNSTSSIASNATHLTPESQPLSIFPTAPVHRKSKPEETTVDEVVRDLGPTTDYVVPLVVAMLAVPLVGVLCALLYMKGRDFWERRHYGRIDFLWDSRNDSRMDFLIDGMYNN